MSSLGPIPLPINIDSLSSAYLDNSKHYWAIGWFVNWISYAQLVGVEITKGLKTQINLTP